MELLPPTSRAKAPRRLGLSAEELTSGPTVFRDGVLKDHVMLITGGGSGMGKATAYLATRLGAKVMIAGRREERLKETADDIRNRLGVEIGWKAMTIRDPDQVQSLVDDTLARFGRIDTLVNSAGGQFIQRSLDYSRKGWLAVIDTNLNGQWWMMQTVARHWRDAERPGGIVNVVAVVDRGVPSAPHTAAARAGTITLSKSVAVEWAPLNIRVNCVAPGAILSDGIGNYGEEHEAMLPRHNPMGRMGDTWDIAEAIIYLTAPSAKFITGEIIRIDGGGQLWSDGAPTSL